MDNAVPLNMQWLPRLAASVASVILGNEWMQFPLTITDLFKSLQSCMSENAAGILDLVSLLSNAIIHGSFNLTTKQHMDVTVFRCCSTFKSDNFVYLPFTAKLLKGVSQVFVQQRAMAWLI